MAKKIVTHNGGFHADDVFACATLSLIFENEGINIIRTRDELVINSGDIILDVGRKNDSEKFFDHHQEGGAGVRENMIPYASFGLIWKKFGEKLCDADAVLYVDKVLVQTVDAIDNGFDIAQNFVLKPFTISDCIASFNPTSAEEQDFDRAFNVALSLAKDILKRVIIDAKDISESIKIYKKSFEESPDKRLVISDIKIRKEVLHILPEVLYVVMPYHNNTWSIRAVRKTEESFESKKPLPELWAGKSPEDLQKITGISDANFCHNQLFIANAKSKEGAIELAKLALNS